MSILANTQTLHDDADELSTIMGEMLEDYQKLEKTIHAKQQ
jgi:hypothetical protein